MVAGNRTDLIMGTLMFNVFSLTLPLQWGL